MKARAGDSFTDAAGCVWTVGACTDGEDGLVALVRPGDPFPVTMPTWEWEAIRRQLAEADAHDDAMDGRMWALTGGVR